MGWEGQRSIAPKQDVKDKDLKAKYGPKMVYSYGLSEGQYAIYIYRISYVLECGKEIDLPWDDVVAFCEKHKLHYPTVISDFIYDGDEERLKSHIEKVSDGPDPIDPRHIREGVCIRIDGTNWQVFKQKGWNYRSLSGFNMEQVGFVDPEDVS